MHRKMYDEDKLDPELDPEEETMRALDDDLADDEDNLFGDMDEGGFGKSDTEEEMI